MNVFYAIVFTVHLVSGLAVMFFMGSATKNTWEYDDKKSRVAGISACIGGFLMAALGTIGLVYTIISGG